MIEQRLLDHPVSHSERNIDNVLKRICKFLLIKDDEMSDVGYFLFFFFLIGAGLALGRSTTDALFFKRYGIQYLPVMYVILAGLMMLVSLTYAAFADRVPAERLFKIFLVTLVVLLCGNWILIAFTTLETAYPLYFLLYELASDLLIVHFSLYLSQNFESMQAKRLFPLIFAGAQLGSMVGGLFLAATVKSLGTSNMLLIWCVLVVSALGVLWLRHRRTGVSQYYRPVRKHRGGLRQAAAQISEGVAFARRSPLVRASSFALFFTVITFYILCYTVNRIYNQAFKTADELTAFFGGLTAVTSALALLIQVFLTNKLLYRFGVRTANLVFPVTSVVSYVFLIASFSVPSAVLASVNKETLMKAFRNPVRNLLFNALPSYMQGRVRALGVGLVLPLALALAGGFLYLVQIIRTPMYFLVAGLITSLLYLYFNLKTNRAYVASIVSVLREKLFVPDRQFDMALKGAGDAAFDELARGVAHPNEDIAVACAGKLMTLFPERAAEIILSRLPAANPPARDRLVPLQPPQFRDYLWRELARADARLRATLLDILFEMRDERARALVAEALASDHPRVRAAGIAGVFRYGLEDTYEPAHERWLGLLNADDIGANLAGLELLKKYPEARYASALIAHLSHASARNRMAALAALAAWPHAAPPDLAAHLTPLADDPDHAVRLAGVRCYRLLPPAQRDRLALAALEDADTGVRACAARVILEAHAPDRDFLAGWILEGRGSTRAQEAAVRGLIDAHTQSHVLERIALQKADAAHRLARACDIVRSDAAQTPALELLAIALDERVHETVDLSLLAVEHIEDPQCIGVIRAGLRSGDQRHIANACEALRNLHNRRLATLLSELLDSFAPKSAASIAVSHRAHDVAGVLDWVRHDHDPWLRACAEHAHTTTIPRAA